ncbi:NAD(P)H-dependent oxidoreductase (plasmid) [Methylocapsa polymorpha]|uniref:NAD(P)H-dependent oxidoreductase n=1 Tax=Methylocapsa polymorpha TaxID=3080828 RepID=A0ABZ0HYI9_9HYPH|nr:NAD(P)H-dependent oxidoreductase [Methylocapsa sp. RX1]WOJ91643.1 NAD(P)H-dependent oxidoreductase [Methylocapsa sp. RX1]
MTIPAAVVTLVSPLWWRSFPAMLKGYVDGVFTAGSGYLGGSADKRPSLAGKTGAVVMTAESSLDDLKRGGALRALKTEHKEMFDYCEVEIAGELYLGGIGPGMSQGDGEQRLEAVRRFARRTFP